MITFSFSSESVHMWVGGGWGGCVLLSADDPILWGLWPRQVLHEIIKPGPGLSRLVKGAGDILHKDKKLRGREVGGWRRREGLRAGAPTVPT